MNPEAPRPVDDKEELHKIRHSAAHIMAAAVIEAFPGAKVAIGPAIDDGFYYDFDLPRALTPDDLEKIEARMKELVKEKIRFERRVLTRAEAEALFRDQPYKLELIRDLPPGEEISIYTSGAFVDLCRGPHVDHTGKIKPNALKLLSVAGAYWRGDEKRPMLQRIYGTAWRTVDDLQKHLAMLEEAKRRDHRTLGRELDLFSIHPEAGGGLIYWHPKGARIRHLVESFWKEEHFKNGYELIQTPHIGRSWLWETSGHLGFYNENMYSPIDIEGDEYYLKPMNCPFHIMIYKTRQRSYRDLPVRWAELGTVYRYERSGVLHGLLRVRGFTQDDAHIICTPDQVESEILEVLRFSLDIWRAFGFTELKAYLATRPGKSVGEPERWEMALQSLRRAIERENLPYELDEGGGAFYGPKIDLKVKDALGREWQMSTIQFDFNLPERFGMTFVGADGKEHRPYMVHRALLGSIERFFGVLVEHYAGAFPAWLNPVQAAVLPVAPELNDYAVEVHKALADAGFRVTVDLDHVPLAQKIKSAQAERVPYMVILGGREKESRTVSMRLRGNKQVNGIPLADAIAQITEAVRTKAAGSEGCRPSGGGRGGAPPEPGNPRPHAHRPALRRGGGAQPS